MAQVENQRGYEHYIIQLIKMQLINNIPREITVVVAGTTVNVPGRSNRWVSPAQPVVPVKISEGSKVVFDRKLPSDIKLSYSGDKVIVDDKINIELFELSQKSSDILRWLLLVIVVLFIVIVIFYYMSGGSRRRRYYR